jgi:hypothetical protein
VDRSKGDHQMCRRFVASRNGETYRILRRFPLAVMFALAGCALLQGCERSEEQHIVAELDGLSQGDRPGMYFAGFDYVCFDYTSGSAREEFGTVAEKKSIPIAQSLAECGVGRSCCNMNSDVGGVVGLIKDGAIRCVELQKANSSFLTDRPICAKPSELIVTRGTLTTRVHPPQRPWIAMLGQTYYEIAEKTKE